MIRNCPDRKKTVRAVFFALKKGRRTAFVFLRFPIENGGVFDFAPGEWSGNVAIITSNKKAPVVFIAHARGT
jgi:hypothetical protein